VSLVNNYRSQIGAILNSSPYDKLISRIKAKIEAKPTESATEKKQGTTTKKTKRKPYEKDFSISFNAHPMLCLLPQRDGGSGAGQWPPGAARG